MYKTFKHNGKIGDVIFSLPTIRELGGGILYLPENTPDACAGMYSSLKDLLLLQPYIHEVREYPSGLNYRELAPDIAIDFDLDDARLQPMKGVIHIVKRYMDQFGVNYPNLKDPWLQLPDMAHGHDLPEEYVLVNYTGRHIVNDHMNIKSRVDWKEVVKSIKKPVYFVGHESEYHTFANHFAGLPYLKTDNLLQLALVIKGAHSIYCNQSAVLALSQSMAKQYYLDVKPFKTNCLLYTNNEHLLL
jgi:ADP-heptose:LPS heptosyltransferase